MESWALRASHWQSVEAGCVEGQTGTREPGYGTARCPGRQYWVLNDSRYLALLLESSEVESPSFGNWLEVHGY